MRIGTYNIAAGRFCNHDMSILSKEIYRQNIDLLGLQEVDNLTKRSGQTNQIKELTNNNVVFSKFSKAIDHDGGEYGIGFLSKLPVNSFTCELLNSNDFEQRIYQNFFLHTNNHFISFYNTHLSFEDNAIRKKQMEYLKELLDNDTSEYKILTGDFNISSTEEFEIFLDNYNIINGHNGIWHDTFPGDDCISHKLDNIILSKNFSINNIQVINNNNSDHYMLLVDVTL